MGRVCVFIILAGYVYIAIDWLVYYVSTLISGIRFVYG